MEIGGVGWMDSATMSHDLFADDGLSQWSFHSIYDLACNSNTLHVSTSLQYGSFD